MGKLTLRGFRTVHGEQMLAHIAAQANLGRSSLRHCKAFLSGSFKQAKRLGILDGLNSTVGLTQNIYIKSVNESQVSALDSLSEKFEICNDHATNQTRVIQ